MTTMFASYDEFVSFSSWTMIVVAIPTFFALLFIKAPYGRYASTSWGPLIPAVPGWVFMEGINIWITLYIFFHLSNEKLIRSQGNQICLGLFVLHYINRSFIYPFRMRNPTPMTIFIMCASTSFCSWNSINQALSLLVVNEIPDAYVQSPLFVLGVAIFFIGFATNIYADTVLLNLRKPGDKPGTYKIPKGGVYEWISCPNYGIKSLVIVHNY
jgi:steroid 5-alpha-reductase